MFFHSDMNYYFNDFEAMFYWLFRGFKQTKKVVLISSILHAINLSENRILYTQTLKERKNKHTNTMMYYSTIAKIKITCFCNFQSVIWSWSVFVWINHMQLADQEANWCFIDSIHFVFISFFPEYKIHTTQIVFLIKLHRPFYTTAYKSTIIMSKLKQFSFVFNSFFLRWKNMQHARCFDVLFERLRQRQQRWKIIDLL